MTKIFLALGIFAASTGVIHAQYLGTGSNPNSHGVSGYTRSNGTYVQPYTATNPNSTQRDNYGTSGNYNPNNGHTGNRSARY